MNAPPLHIQVILAMILTSVIQAGLTFLATWGLLPGLDIGAVSSGLAASLSAAIVTALGTAWTAWLVRRSKVVDAGVTLASQPDAPKEEKQLIINATAELPEVKDMKVTDKAMAAAAPANVTVAK